MFYGYVFLFYEWEGRKKMAEGIRLTEEQIEDLARPLVRLVKEFYKDPKNVAAFEAWKAEKEKKEKKEKKECTA